MGTVPVVATETSTPAKKKTKSRNGCITCKQKRLKCDELKPACMNCLKKNIECGGYSTRFKWIEPTSSKKATATPTSINGRKTSDTSPGPSAPPSVQDGGRKPNLLLNQHLEMTSLSVLGKTLREVKKENDLLARGINPKPEPQNPNVPAPAPKRMRRSFTLADAPRPESSVLMRRSNSTNSTMLRMDVGKLGNDMRNESGLHSLAEAAIDEMDSRSPDPVLSLSPGVPHQFPQPRPKLETSHVTPNGTGQTPMALIPYQTPKEWLFNGTFGHDQHVQFSPVRSQNNDLDLTPSLSALINYVFTTDGGADGPSLELHHDTPFSPLDLSGDDAMSNSIATRHPAEHGHQRSPEDSSLLADVDRNHLLYNIGDFLKRNEAPSPSISSTASTESLMATSEHEQILFLYSTYTCGIMSIKAGPMENPWKEIFVPLARDYSYVFNSIAAMTLFHLAGNRKVAKQSDNLRSKGYFYMKKCILELANGLKKIDDLSCENPLPADIALCTCLNLAISESWDTHTSSGIAHLKGAKSMIQKVFMLIKQYSREMMKPRGGSKVSAIAELKNKLVLVSDEEWQRLEGVYDEPEGDSPVKLNTSKDFIMPRNLQLLFNQWIYLHVLSQMTAQSNQDERGIDLVATITSVIQSTQKKIREEKEQRSSEYNDLPTHSESAELNLLAGSNSAFGLFGEFDSIFNNSDYIDPLLGCSQSLFLMMAKVASLISKIRKERLKLDKHFRNSLTHMSQASELKQQLSDWKPNISPQLAEAHNNNRSRNSTWDLYSCVSTAEAYRYATLLYLHQAVPELPLLTSHQLAEKVFILMAAVPTASNLYIIHVFPLLISSCEAEPGDEREWCKRRWQLLSERLWIGNIDRAFEVVKEVWRRKDEFFRKRRREMENTALGNKSDIEDPNSISTQISGLMAAIHNDGDDNMGICSPLHWSTIMKEWGWEVFLG